MNEGEDMMRRVYGVAVVVTCILLAAGCLAGCFGSGEAPTTMVTTSVDLSSLDTSTTSSVSTTSTAAPTLIDGLPVGYVESIGQRPIVVLFYVGGGVDDENVLKSVRESQGRYSSYTYLVYDYSLPATYGDLPGELEIDGLEIGYMPYLILIDRHAVIQTAWSGYVDAGTLDQLLVNLGRY